jgi:hypothetical protein
MVITGELCCANFLTVLLLPRCPAIARTTLNKKETKTENQVADLVEENAAEIAQELAAEYVAEVAA